MNKFKRAETVTARPNYFKRRAIIKHGEGNSTLIFLRFMFVGLLGLSSCSSTSGRKSGLDEYETFYVNQKPRTRFYLKNDQIADTIFFYGENGGEIRKIPRSDIFSSNKISYNDSGLVSINPMMISKELDIFWERFSMAYTPLYEKGTDSYLDYIVVINSRGQCEHAVVFKNHRCSMQMVLTAVEELERWKYSIHKEAKLSVFFQRIQFSNLPTTNRL